MELVGCDFIFQEIKVMKVTHISNFSDSETKRSKETS